MILNFEGPAGDETQTQLVESNVDYSIGRQKELPAVKKKQNSTCGYWLVS